MRRPNILLPLAALSLAALLAILPLLIAGPSCGHDYTFHVQSWLDAAAQFRHGNLNPHWTFSAAYNAGEPRFLFYPPLSWTLGALLTMIFPAMAVPTIYTWIALTSAGLAMYRLARSFAPENIALMVSALYVANPYMLFNAFERSAYAELLAAAWLPMLLLAALRERPGVLEVALPVALLWLTNAPAAVMGCYALAAIVLVRLVLPAVRPDALAAHPDLRQRARAALGVAAACAGGTLLGLALAGFYLLPAASERHFVQIAMAIIPNMRVEDNFLFGYDGDGPHDAVLHTASIIATALSLATAAALLALFLRRRAGEPARGSTSPGRKSSTLSPRITALTILVLAICVVFLLTPMSTPLWKHLPDLAFLQFPWRFISVMAVLLCLSVAMLFRGVRLRLEASIPLGAALVAALSLMAIAGLRQPCEVEDRADTLARQFAAHRGVEPTDEYTPAGADNDTLRPDDPPFWLSTDPASFARETTANPAASKEEGAASEAGTPAPARTARPASAPFDFMVQAPAREFLILNLRAYPEWQIAVNGRAPQSAAQREDGLIVIPIDAGRSVVHVEWQRSLDQRLGLALSGLALIICVGLGWPALAGRGRCG